MRKFRFYSDGNLEIVSIPIVSREKNKNLRIWVDYQRGRRHSLHDGKFINRGYYIFFSVEEIESCALGLTSDSHNIKVFIGGVERKSKHWDMEFAELAEKIAPIIIENNFSDMDLDLENMTIHKRYGNEERLGMWSEYFKIETPQKEWLKKLKPAS